MRNGKSASDIPAELLKYGVDSSALLQELHKILVELLEEPSRLPASWGVSKLSTLYKNKGSRNDPKMYRPLSIGSTVTKFTVSLLLMRVDKWYNNNQLLDSQQGFRRGRGTQDAIFTIKRIHQITEKMRKLVYCIYIDLTAAFDAVQRLWMFKSIYNRMPPSQSPKCFELLEQLYRTTSVYLSDDPECENFGTPVGVRQGGPESPPLFCLFMDAMTGQFEIECTAAGIKGVSRNCRVPNTSTSRAEWSEHPSLGSVAHMWVGLADDLTLFFNRASELERAMEILCAIFDRHGLLLSKQKTETMILNHGDPENYPKSILKLGDYEVANSKNFKLLESQVKYDESSTGDLEVSARIEAGLCKFAQLRALLTNHRVKLEYRMRFTRRTFGAA